MRAFRTNFLLVCFAFFLSIACATQAKKPTATPEPGGGSHPPTFRSPELSPEPLGERTKEHFPSATTVPCASTSAAPRMDKGPLGPEGAIPLSLPGGPPVSTPAGRVVPKVHASDIEL